MGKNSRIEWTHHTFNPWWGCVKVSPACTHCYAERDSKRFGFALWGPDSERRFFGDKHWNEPLKWNRTAGLEGDRHRVFCASMADVFEDRPELDPHRTRLWNLIEETSNLDWLLLTKRPENAPRMLPWKTCPTNVWFGVTMEDQEWLLHRLEAFKAVSARIKFVSIEPMLGPVDLSPLAGHVHWVIAGAESGNGARHTHIDWVRSLRDWCHGNGVSFFLKQLVEDGKMVGTPFLDGRTHVQAPG